MSVSIGIRDANAGCSPRLVKLPELMARTARSRSAVYRLINNDPSFPKPITIGVRCVAWVESEVDAYIRRQIEQRDAKEMPT
jgi:prophage regulatory protein